MYIAFIFESRHVIDYINNLSRSPLYIGDLSRYGVTPICIGGLPTVLPFARIFSKGFHRYSQI